MKVIAQKTGIGQSSDKSDIFVIEATRHELIELGSFGPETRIRVDTEITLNATRARLNAIKNIADGDNYDSVLKLIKELLRVAEFLQPPLITLKHDAKAIDTNPQ